MRSETGVEETISLEEFEGRVRQGLIEPSTPVRFAVLTGDAWVEARELDVFRRLYAPARIHFARAFTLARFPFLTLLFVALQVVLFFGVAGTHLAVPLDPLMEAGAKARSNILELGETWRLLTANVLHRDILHLVVNMFFLFNVGGAIENAYRPQDYVLLLVVSALCTTVLSTMMSSLPSVGASGIVFGLFGAATVFGYKYRDILPQRYRHYFGGVVLTYALFVLYAGLASKDTDNWGHLGGLMGGMGTALMLEARLLHLGRPARRALHVNASMLIALGLVLVTLGLGVVIRAFGPELVVFESPESGLRIERPSLWATGENHLGYPAWGNGLGASIGLRAERRAHAPVSLPEVREHFLEAELRARERDGDITAVMVREERPLVLKGGRAIELYITLESTAGRQVTRNVLVSRGYYSYVVVLSAPEAYARAYAPIFDRMVLAIQLTEPSTLKDARSRVTTFPGMSSAHVELGRELASIGEVKAAEQSYQRSLQALPEQADALYGLAKLAADYDGDMVSAEKIATRLYEPHPEEASYAALLADLRQRLGQLDGACAVLQETLDHVSDPQEGLRERLRSLKCGSLGALEP